MSDKNILDNGEEENGVLSGEASLDGRMIDGSFQQDDMLRAAIAAKSVDLKTAFRPGSIPLATDFANLIDVAEYGRRAVGRSADQTDHNVGAGLTLAADADPAHRGKLSIKAGNGITVDGNGVGIDPERVLPRGVIVMFSGTAVPRGWALCDGKDGKTPDLRNRFVLAGELGDLNKKSTNSVDANKSYTAESDSKSAAIHVKVGATALSIEQIPAHGHRLTADGAGDAKLSLTEFTATPGQIKGVHAIAPLKIDHRTLFTTSVGGGKGHAHIATATQDAHRHTTTITTPYYVLAFIMKT